jgi:hypothetical protein
MFNTLMRACHDLLVDCSAQMLIAVGRTSLGIKLHLNKSDMTLAKELTAQARRDADEANATAKANADATRTRQMRETVLSWQEGQASCSGVKQAETNRFAWTAGPDTVGSLSVWVT